MADCTRAEMWPQTGFGKDIFDILTIKESPLMHQKRLDPRCETAQDIRMHRIANHQNAITADIRVATQNFFKHVMIRFTDTLGHHPACIRRQMGEIARFHGQEVPHWCTDIRITDQNWPRIGRKALFQHFLLLI